MTTPNQPAPDGAFVIGGNRSASAGLDTTDGYNFGQQFTETGIRALFELPALTLVNMLDVLRDVLLKLPLEALQMFKPLIPDFIEEQFDDVVSAVDAILGALIAVVEFLSVDVFQGFLGLISGDPGASMESVAGLLSDGLQMIQQLIESLLGMLGIDASGTWLDQIFDIADGFDEQFGSLDGLLGSFDDLLGGFGGATDPTQAGNFLSDLLGLLGDPTGVGTGTPTLPGIGSIPLLGGLLSGGTLLSGLIPNLSASKITSGTFGTGLIPGLPASQITSGTFGAGLIPSLDASKIGTGTFLDSFVPGLPNLMDALFGGFSGATSSGATQSNVEAVSASQADATAGNSALITQIQAALGAGTPDSDDFERATLGANWTYLASSGTGTIPDSHNFHFSGTGSNEYVMRKNNIVSATDHITSTIVLNQAIPTNLIAIPPFGGNIDVWVRMTGFTTYATRTGVRLRIKSNVLSAAYTLSWVSNGTATTLDTGSCPVPAGGGILSLEAGASATPRKFIGTLNGTPFMDFTDTGLVTTIGTSNRYRGFGGIGATGIGFSVGTPDIRQWTAVG